MASQISIDIAPEHDEHRQEECFEHTPMTSASPTLCVNVWEDSDVSWERTHQFNAGLELDGQHGMHGEKQSVHLPTTSLRVLQNLRDALHAPHALSLELTLDGNGPEPFGLQALLAIATSFPETLLQEASARLESMQGIVRQTSNKSNESGESDKAGVDDKTLVCLAADCASVDVFVISVQTQLPEPVVLLARLAAGAPLRCLALVIGSDTDEARSLARQVSEALAAALTDEGWAAALQAAACIEDVLQAFDAYLSTLIILPNVHVDEKVLEEGQEADEESQDALLSEALVSSIEKIICKSHGLERDHILPARQRSTERLRRKSKERESELHKHQRCFVEVSELVGQDDGLWHVTHRLRQGLELDENRDRLHLPHVSVPALSQLRQLLTPAALGLGVTVTGEGSAVDAIMHQYELAGLSGTAFNEVKRALFHRACFDGVAGQAADLDLGSQACSALLKPEVGDEVCYVFAVSCSHFHEGKPCVASFLQLKSPLSFCFPGTCAPARFLLVLAGPESKQTSLSAMADTLAALMSDEDLFWDLAVASDPTSFISALDARLEKLMVIPHTKLRVSSCEQQPEDKVSLTEKELQSPIPPASPHQASDVSSKPFQSLRQKCTRIAGTMQKYAMPLIFGVLAALVWRNVDEERYWAFTHDAIIPGASIFTHKISIHFIVNDIFMCFFFGLAVKEVTEALLPGGTLFPLKRAVNPLMATLGGVVGPAVAYLAAVSVLHASGSLDDLECKGVASHRRLAGLSSHEPCTLGTLMKGWGVPTATDISLAWMLSVVIFGPGHPAIGFLLLLAIVDDAIGMVIIATAYSDPYHPVEPVWLLLVLLAMVAALVLRKLNVSWWSAYIFGCGPISWLGLLLAHVHPALALVFVVPFMPAWHKGGSDDTNGDHNPACGNIPSKLSKAANDAAAFLARHNSHDAPLDNFEHSMKLLVDFGMFFFGLSNAGVPLQEVGGITAAVLFALVVGKTLGIAGFSLLAHALGFSLPRGLSVLDLFALSALGGVGLTVALFVANVAFEDDALQGQAKFAALLSVGSALLAFSLKRVQVILGLQGEKSSVVAVIKEALPDPYLEDEGVSYVDDLLVEEITHILWLQRRYAARSTALPLDRVAPRTPLKGQSGGGLSGISSPRSPRSPTCVRVEEVFDSPIFPRMEEEAGRPAECEPSIPEEASDDCFSL
eukprot:TRINITY_DN40082_c0_g1_i1.p1 TRINITY_DN40082_c0_g1~~TRINITY_DN40082_c0_g1_i1.p1  ORF type:complete len:1190 (+),score=216.93 TRINITY_DN40082_c0_g1_i1:23-3571(+)